MMLALRLTSVTASSSQSRLHWDWRNQALAALIEIIKIGMLPMATLVISFYFTSGTKK